MYSDIHIAYDIQVQRHQTNTMSLEKEMYAKSRPM